MKRTLTAEQIAARDSRRSAFRELCRKIKAFSTVEMAQWQAAAAGIMTVDGRTLSDHNMILCYFQRAGVTVVGGFRQWLKAGRAVRKGEHGLMIWVPIGAPKAADDGAVAVSDSGEKPGFITGTVFDVTQTDEIECDADKTAVDAGGEIVPA